MLQKPDLPDETIASCLSDEYALSVAAITFLTLGGDADTAVYRVIADDRTAYFLKLRRRGAFAESSVEVPQLLHDRGIESVITPIATTIGRLWTALENFSVVLYPFIEGRNAFEVPFSDRQWIEFGAALKGVHTAKLSPAARAHISSEGYDPRWRDLVRELQESARRAGTADSIAAPLAELLRSRNETITDLVERAERLGAALRRQQSECVLCHADLHAFNVLISDRRLYIVDWDTTVFAPKERDLMFIGGGVGGVWNTDREVELFYTGYGATEVSPTALAYYRYERIVEDIAAFSDELLLDNAGEAARAEALAMLHSQFASNGVVDIAFRSDSGRTPTPR